MKLRFPYYSHKRNCSHHKVAGFTLVELLVIIAILAILTVVGFLILGNTTTTARDSQRIANIRQLHDATRLQVASLHTLPMPYQAIPISIGGGSGTIDLTISGATSQYAVFVDGSTQLSTLTGSRLLALTRDGGVDSLLAGGTFSGALSNQNLGWQGYADASIAGSLNYSDTVDPQDQTLFTYRLGQNRDKSQFLAYLENPENENNIPLLWNITDQANAATTDYTKRYPYVWGDRLGIVLDKGSNAPVQQGLTPPVNNSGSTGSGNVIDTSGMMVGVGQGHSCVLKVDQSVVCWGDDYDGQTDVPLGLVDVVQISVGYYHSCALQSDGFVDCWGQDNEDGRTAVGSFSDVTQISAGGEHTCALKSDGSVQCVGENWDGQTTIPSLLSNVVQISAGGYHTCALKSDATVECWGSNDNGQIDIPLGLSNITQVSAGKYHTCALKSDATVECWGINMEGENPAAYVPPGLADVTQISSDSSYNCALKSDGSVECWGEYWNSDGWSVSSNYVPLDLSNVVQISAGSEYTCVIKSDSSVVCWDLFGYLPVPEELQNFPVILNSVVFDDHRLTTGNNFTCAITSTGGVECWGANDVGQLDVPVGLDNVIEVNAGYGFACALKSDGTVECWGDPSGGQTDVPVGLNDVVQMSVGYNNVCALKLDGTVVCWGDNSDGQTTVPSGLNHIVQIATGWNFACALKDTGRMVCWGQNYSGLQNPPSDIGIVKQISAGDEHMCAVKTDDSLACWGSNSDLSGASDVAHVSAGEYYSCLAHTDGSVECGGENGDGQTDVPITLSGVTEISTSMGGSHTCALKSNNTIECWGQGMEGQTDVPPEFGGIASSPITEPVFEDQGMTTGYQFTCALKSDGTVECWGLNDNGQADVPSGLADVTQISAGASHVCALKSDATVECWGLNDDGQATLPSGLTDVVQVISGDYHSCALRSDRTLTCWGSDSDGQTDVPTLTRVAQLAAGSAYTCALRETGRVFCWGVISGDIGVDNVVKISAGGGNFCTMKADGSVECFTQSTFVHGENMIPSSLSAIDIATSPTHVCARDASNQIICWGSNWEGESDSPAPFGSGFTPLNLSSIRYEDYRISAGNHFTCALKSDGTVECWGYNAWDTATPPNGLSDVIQITSGHSHTCALKSDGTVECWGYNGAGENDVPPGLTDVVQISAGSAHTCALKSDNTIECWGSDYYQESNIPPSLNHDIVEVVAGYFTTCVLQSNGKMQCIGGNSIGFRNDVQVIGSTTTSNGIAPCTIQDDSSVRCNQYDDPPSGLVNVIKVANNDYEACALKSDGTVECWGQNYSGQSDVPSGLSDVVDITLGISHVCATKSDNTVVCWGNNDDGQTDIPAALEPVIVPNVIYEDTNLSAGTSHTCTIESGTAMCTGYMDQMENNIAQVSAGGTDTCVLKTDGTVACYGVTINYSNLDGYEQLDVPAGLNNVIQISSGQGYNCALKSDGTVECWGKYGHIDPTVPSLSDIVSIVVAESGYHACALKSDGTVECWGSTYHNALSIPSGLNAVKQISAGYGYTCVLKSNGKVTCWGSNASGRSTVPVGLSNVVQISSGGSHSCALKSDGTVECWGNNTSGQRSVPSGLSGVVDITTGNAHSCALKSDDNIVCWGSNGHSQGDINNLVTLPNSISNSVSPIFEEKNISTMHGNSYSSGNFFYACAINSNSNVECWFDYENTGYEEAYVPPLLTNVVQVIVGNTQSCALKSDGMVECWRFRPEYATLILGPAFPLSSVIQISGDGDSICALRSDGTLVCWGDNFYEQNTLPVGVGPVKQVSHGGGSICALKSDATVACWGNNYSGQNNIPSGLTGVVQISHNGASVCALKSDTTVICWGTGTGYGGSGLEPPIGLSDVVQINQSCALKSDGTVVCWNKENSLVELYDDHSTKGFTDVIEVNGNGICAFKSNLTLSCWDDSSSNYLNVPSSFSPESIISPILNENYLSVGGGDSIGNIICYIKSDTHVECGQWGKHNISGDIGNHPTNAGPPPGPGIYEETFLEPGQDFWKECASDMTWCDLVQWKASHNQPPANLDNIVQVVNNNGFVCALQSNGSVTCWYPLATAYPSGTIENIPPETSSGVTALFNGLDTCVLKTDASTLCIDYQSPGNYTSNAPSVTNIVEMSGHCTLTSDGRVSCSNTPILAGIDHVKSIEAAGNKYCAITGENRTLVCWLRGGQFNTSLGSVEFAQDTPNSLGPITSVAIGYNHTCALKPNGTMECWGGDNTHGENDVPIGLSGVMDISIGDHVSCAMLSNQTVRCWGSILD